jgi:hypothetical protein
MNAWVQKSRLHLKRGRRGWHCNAYLDGTGGDRDKPFPSGGRDSTKSPQSMAYIRQVRPGDLIVLFQVDDDAIHALAQADSAGMEADPGSGEYNLFMLEPAERAFRLRNPLTVEKLRQTGCDPECFGQGMRGRLFPLKPEELVGILKAVPIVNPDQQKELAAWIQQRSAQA